MLPTYTFIFTYSVNRIYILLNHMQGMKKKPHVRNEEKRQELISCFQEVWTQGGIFGRMREGDLKWNLTPHKEFLPVELGAWNSTPIRINRLSPSPDPEAEFTARADFSDLIDDFLNNINDHRAQPDDEAHSQGNPEELNNAQMVVIHAPNQAETTQGNTNANLYTGGQDALQPPYDPRNGESEVVTASHQTNYTPLPRRESNQKRKASTLWDKENLAPTLRVATGGPAVAPDNQQIPSSRNKRKCYKKRHTHRAPFSDLQSCELQEQPVSVPSYRREDEQAHMQATSHACESTQHKGKGEDKRTTQQHLPTSRTKRRCFFGPNKHRGKADNASPSLAFDIPTTSQQNRLPTQEPADHRPPPQSSSVRSQVGRSRPTLTLPFHRYKSPLERRKDKTPQEPQPNPYRFIQRKLGLTETEFDNRLTQDIDELLQEIENERRLALLESLPCGRVLTKDDCKQLFPLSRPPTSGSLLGIYSWAHDLLPDPPEPDAAECSRGTCDGLPFETPPGPPGCAPAPP